MSAPRIVRFEIDGMPRPKPTGFADRMPKIVATFDNGERKELFDYYPDEISFGEGELIGLTEEQAHAVRRAKDEAYLRS